MDVQLPCSARGLAGHRVPDRDPGLRAGVLAGRENGARNHRWLAAREAKTVWPHVCGRLPEMQKTLWPIPSQTPGGIQKVDPLMGVPIKYPLVARVPKLRDLLFRSSRVSGFCISGSQSCVLASQFRRPRCFRTSRLRGVKCSCKGSEKGTITV